MPLKIAHLADTHIGMENYGRVNPETGLNQRLHDFLGSLDQAIDGAIEANVDLVVFAGEIYQTRGPGQGRGAGGQRRPRRSARKIPPPPAPPPPRPRATPPAASTGCLRRGS